MPSVRYYTVRQTREVRVRVTPERDESYEQAALRVSTDALENAGDFGEGMNHGMIAGMPKIVETNITRENP